MPLPKITNPSPTNIAAVEAKTYTELFVTRFNVSGAQLTVEATPYNYAKDERSTDSSKAQSYTFENVYALAAEFPVVANSMGLLTYAVSLLIPLQVAQKQLAAIGEDEVDFNGLTDEEIEAAKLRNEQRAADRIAPAAALESLEQLLRAR